MQWVIIGDEVSVLGWRVAGARALIATPETVRERFAEAQRAADLILMTADLAGHLPQAVLDAALLSEQPLLAVIAAAAGTREPPDLDQDVKRVLGIAV